jgi:hypothetical protein
MPVPAGGVPARDRHRVVAVLLFAFFGTGDTEGLLLFQAHAGAAGQKQARYARGQGDGVAFVTNGPVVSVIVPCFNYGRFLVEALESVQRQTFSAWECIVIDDGSKDNSSDIADSFASRDPRFSCIRQANRGPSAARNAGLANAVGQCVQLLDADDLLEPEKLQVHVEFLAQHHEFAMVYSAMRFFTGEGSVRTFSRGRNETQRDWMTMWPDTNNKLLIALVEGNTFPISAPLFRRSALDEVGHFDESLPSHEDWEFWLRWAFAGMRFYGLDAPGTRTLVREHGDSLTMHSVTMAETRLAVRARIQKLALTEALRAKNQECAIYDACELGAAHLAAGHWKVGVQVFFPGFVRAERKTKAIHLLLAHLTPRWLLALWRRLRWGAPARESG